MMEHVQVRRNVAHGHIAVLMATVALVASACGGAADDAAEAAVATPAPTVAATVPATEPPTTTTTPPTTSPPTSAPTTAPTTTSTTTSTTTTTTSTLPEETEPIEPPTDVWAEEPVIDLGTLAIPKIDVEMTMYEGIRLSTLDFGPGHWPGTAMPGQVGNMVVAGHRTSNHQVFRNVDQLVPGDEIVFTDDRGEHVYRVTRTEIVEPTAMWIVDPTETATATLFACHPPGSTAQRIVVFADLVTG